MLPIGFSLKEEDFDVSKTGRPVLFRPVHRQPVQIVGTSEERFNEWSTKASSEVIILRYDTTLTFLSTMCKVLSKEPSSASTNLLVQSMFETHLGKTFVLKLFLQTLQQKVNDCFEKFQQKIIVVHVPITLVATMNEALTQFMQQLSVRIYVNEVPKESDAKLTDWIRFVWDAPEA